MTDIAKVAKGICERLQLQKLVTAETLPLLGIISELVTEVHRLRGTTRAAAGGESLCQPDAPRPSFDDLQIVSLADLIENDGPYPVNVVVRALAVLRQEVQTGVMEGNQILGSLDLSLAGAAVYRCHREDLGYLRQSLREHGRRLRQTGELCEALADQRQEPVAAEETEGTAAPG